MHEGFINVAVKRISLLLLSLTLVGAAVSPRNACADALADAHTAYESRNYVVARDIWTRLAQSGDPGAQYRLGLMYDLGQGVKASLEHVANLMNAFATASEDDFEAAIEATDERVLSATREFFSLMRREGIRER